MEISTIISIITAGITILTTIIGFAYGAGVLSQKIKRNKEDIKPFVDKGILQKVARNEKDIKNNSDDLKNLSTLHSKVDTLIDLFRNSKSEITQAQSHLKLTEKGKKIANDLKAVKIIGGCWETIVKKLQAKEITTQSNLYDIQQACFEIGKTYAKIIDVSTFERIKTYAYQNGQNLYDYNLLFGILIRDVFFQKNDLSEIK